MIKLSLLQRESERPRTVPDPSLEKFLIANRIGLFSNWVYHGTPLWGLKHMLTEGIYGTEHGEVAEEDTFSTSINSEVLRLFSEGDGDTGLQFKVDNIKLIVVDDFIHKLVTVLPGSGMAGDIDVDEDEFTRFCEKYKIPFTHGEYYLPYGYLSSLGVDAFVFDYVWKRFQKGYGAYGGDNDESEICFIGKGIQKLNNLIESIYVDGESYDLKDKVMALKDIEEKVEGSENSS